MAHSQKKVRSAEHSRVAASVSTSLERRLRTNPNEGTLREPAENPTCTTEPVSSFWRRISKKDRGRGLGKAHPDIPPRPNRSGNTGCTPFENGGVPAEGALVGKYRFARVPVPENAGDFDWNNELQAGGVDEVDWLPPLALVWALFIVKVAVPNREFLSRFSDPVTPRRIFHVVGQRVNPNYRQRVSKGVHATGILV
jgi:hypothetical protein